MTGSGADKRQLGPGDELFDGREVGVLFNMNNTPFGAIRVEARPEGLVFWAGGEIRWKSFDSVTPKDPLARQERLGKEFEDVLFNNLWDLDESVSNPPSV